MDGDRPIGPKSDDTAQARTEGALGELAMGQYQTFVVRLWADGAGGAARGHIQHIASRRGMYFRDSEKMLQFIHDHLLPSILPANGHDRDDQRDAEDCHQSPASSVRIVVDDSEET